MATRTRRRGICCTIPDKDDYRERHAVECGINHLKKAPRRGDSP
ncbi:hypothetical protein [Streptomyces sp. NPDC019937]